MLDKLIGGVAGGVAGGIIGTVDGFAVGSGLWPNSHGFQEQKKKLPANHGHCNGGAAVAKAPENCGGRRHKDRE